VRPRASVAHRLADAYLTQLKAVLPDSILESRSKLVTLRPSWKDVFDATLCLAVVEGAGPREVACKQGILGIRWSGALFHAEGREFESRLPLQISRRPERERPFSV